MYYILQIQNNRKLIHNRFDLARAKLSTKISIVLGF